MVSFLCSICGYRGEVSEQVKGSTVNCQQCGAPNEIPDDEEWFNEFIAPEKVVMQAEEVTRAPMISRHRERVAAQRAAYQGERTLSALHAIYGLLAFLVFVVVSFLYPDMGFTLFVCAAVGGLVTLLIRSAKSGPKR